MFHKTITLSVFALLLAVASCRPQVGLNECSGRENGPHPDELDSNAFYVCFNDELIVHSKCDPGEIFDAQLKTCSGGSADEDLTAYSDKNEVGGYVSQFESRISNLLEDSLKSDQGARYPHYSTTPDYWTTSRRPDSTPDYWTTTPRPQFSTTSHPPSGTRPPRPPHHPFPPPGHPPPPPFKNKIVNVQVTKNIFPKSILIIGRANREQKNK